MYICIYTCILSFSASPDPSHPLPLLRRHPVSTGIFFVPSPSPLLPPLPPPPPPSLLLRFRHLFLFHFLLCFPLLIKLICGNVFCLRLFLVNAGRPWARRHILRPVPVPYIAVCCSVLQCVAVCCSVLQCEMSSSPHPTSSFRTLHCSVLHCVAVCCSVLQYVAVCCSANWALRHNRLVTLTHTLLIPVLKSVMSHIFELLSCIHVLCHALMSHVTHSCVISHVLHQISVLEWVMYWWVMSHTKESYYTIYIYIHMHTYMTWDAWHNPLICGLVTWHVTWLITSPHINGLCHASHVIYVCICIYIYKYVYI